MIGAIIGDIAGSTREFSKDKNYPTELFPKNSHITDDTILILATVDKLLKDNLSDNYGDFYFQYASKYYGTQYSYGDSFLTWVKRSRPNKLAEAYNSFGNGSAVRVVPIGWFFNSLEEVRYQAMYSALPTHNHQEGIKGAEVVASSVFLARKGKTKEEIRKYLENEFDYKLNLSYESVRQKSVFLDTCPKSVEEALICFLDSESFEDAIFKAIALGGDADTQASIAGAIAEAYYFKEIKPISIIDEYLDDDQIKLINDFVFCLSPNISL